MSAARNLLSEAMSLPRAHRLAIAGLIIRQANCKRDEAAGDVLEAILTGLGLAATGTRAPLPIAHGLEVRAAIALAWEAEGLAVERQTQLCRALDVAGMKDASRDAYKLVPDLTSHKGQDASAACEALRGYVEHTMERAVLAQSEKAEAQRDAWVPPSHPEDRNPPAWAERCEGC